MVFNYPDFTTGKTGYTPKAGRTFVTTAMKNNLELTIVSLNDYNHYENHRNLYEKMFNKYQKTLLVSKQDFNKNNKGYYIKSDIYYPLERNEKNDISIKFSINDSDTSEIVVTLKNKEIIHEKVYFTKEKKTIDNNDNIWTKLKKIFNKIF